MLDYKSVDGQRPLVMLPTLQGPFSKEILSKYRDCFADSYKLWWMTVW